MSKYRKVETTAWTDGRARALSQPPPNGHTLWLWLLCGPRTVAIPGVVIAREAVIADDLRWPLEGFREAFAEVAEQGMARADWEAGVVVLTKALFEADGVPRESNKPQSPNVVKAWAKAWAEMPDCELKADVFLELSAYCDILDRLSKSSTKAFGKAFRSAFPKACAIQEAGNRKQEAGGEREAPARASEPETQTGDRDPRIDLALELLDLVEAGKAELRAAGVVGPGTRSVGLPPPAAALAPIRALVAEWAGDGRGLAGAADDLRHHVAVELGDAKLKRDASYLPSMWSAKRVLQSLACEPGQPLGRAPRAAAGSIAAPASAKPAPRREPLLYDGYAASKQREAEQRGAAGDAVGGASS